MNPDEQILKQEKIIADLTAQLSRKNKEIEIILKISKETNSALAVNKIAATLLASMAEIFGFNHLMILLLEEDSAILRVVATYGYESHGVGSTIQVGQGVIGVVAQKKKLMRMSNLVMQRLYMQRVLSRDEAKDDETQPAEKIPLPGLPNSASQVAIPMLDVDKLVGVLAVESPQSNFFNKDDEVLVSILANQAAIAIKNARLNQNLQIANATLQEYSDILEHRVEERTQELSQALAHLKATQNQLVEAEKMAALGGLVAGVAHEINTPVGVGVTAASLLEEKTSAFRQTYQSGQMKRSDLEKYLDIAQQSSTIILRNLHRAAELIQSFKQVAVDQSSEERRVFPVKAYLEEILLSLHPKLKRTPLTIEIHGDDNLSLNSYPGAFAQIVTNLVINSLTHAYEPDQPGRLTFQLQRENGWLIFEYADDGQGIPKEHLGKIFDPFFTTKRGQGGSGLGLHIIYNLVAQKLGGTIRCESERGCGAKFVIELPISQE